MDKAELEADPRPKGSRLAAWICILVTSWIVFAPPRLERRSDPMVERRSSTSRADTVPSDVVPGDVIFRRGRSWNSRAVLLADAGSRYSHVGLAIAGLGGPWVVHATPVGPGTTGGVVREPIRDFLSPERAVEWGVFRVAGRASYELGLAAADAASAMADRHIGFDDAFDLTDGSQLYCTELVWRAYRKAGVDLVGGELEEIRFPGLGEVLVILPSRLSSSPYLRSVEENLPEQGRKP
ncbi:MAG: hypothetical protein MI919_16120 [Holophagales bacterium]|nr:hypothetical protein [Holophagales bacterium]